VPWLLAAVLAAGVGIQSRGCSSSVLPTPPPSGPDLVKAFATNDNRAEARGHARVFGTICTSVAEYLEYDGTRQEPLIKTGVQIDDLRRALRQTRTKGWSFLTKYPGLEGELETFFTRHLGTSGGPIEKAERDKWVAALRQVSACAEYAAKR
jgi:hypothetical protein